MRENIGARTLVAQKRKGSVKVRAEDESGREEQSREEQRGKKETQSALQEKVIHLIQKWL